MRHTLHRRRAPQAGVTLIVVLVLLLVMLLGGLSMARMSEVSTLVAGNVTFKERAVQASEVGINTAFAAIVALPNDNGNQGSWYAARRQDADEDGLPAVDWDSMPRVTVGSHNEFEVRYFVDRQCDIENVINSKRECLLREAPPNGSAKVCQDGDGACDLDPPAGRQFRITVRVTGPKDFRTFVQSLVTKG
ncbi:PilX N-terminal domain-containing pilus assembly protein [Aquincola sp. MAHUQ-54]|uniref:PilX N-terminal domain-containing pilus assembly protein n=1 Tax=Aquincola agrisoli TaxID=3119538 RepID=A0AAW9QJ97_9BURK